MRTNGLRLDDETIKKIKEVAKQNPTWSNVQVSHECNVSADTVRRYRESPPIRAEVKPISTNSTPQNFSESVFTFLRKQQTPLTVEELADHFNVGPSKVRQAIKELEAQNKNLHIREDSITATNEIAPSTPTYIDIQKFKGKTIRFGLTSDNHLGSKYARLDVLNALFDIWADAGITDVYQCGNMIDGEARFNTHDLIVHGIQNQTDYFIENWPVRDGMTTHYVTGDDHEGWYIQREGIDYGDYLQSRAKKAGRNDLEYLGHMEHDIVFAGEKTKSIMRLIHAGGGTAYALSYQPQSIINSYQGGEKPNILLIGHYHKCDFNYWREVLNVSAGTTEDQTPWMRKKNIAAHVGGWTIEFELDTNGLIHRFTPIWHPFYDRTFYENKVWGYHWN